jgi:hypothetical protein
MSAGRRKMRRTNGRNAGQVKRRHRPIPRAGSALILTVVLTSLLAIVGVLFIMTTRLDKLGSSAALDNEQLELAVGSVVSQISQTLADDIPGMSVSKSYYDYPDSNNPWLADLDPCQPSSGTYKWRQITNLTGQKQSLYRNVGVSLVAERAPIVDPNSNPSADADGDGVSDARWYRLPGVVTTKGRPVYAAVRIVDNGGMLNLNTARAWGSNDRYDGTSQLQIGLADMVGRSSTDLDHFRDPNGRGLAAYENAIIWPYWQGPPWPSYSPFTPFSLSDELELRYRFILNREGVDCRAESWGQFRGNYSLSVPVSDQSKIANWGLRVMAGTPLDPNYAFCHVLTTYNMDRILTPDSDIPNKINVNLTDLNLAKHIGPTALYQAVLAALARRGPADSNLAAQITANLIDYIDQDNKVTAIANSSGKLFYGYERPCLCLSEVADRLVKNAATGLVAEAAAIELFKPFFEDGDPNSGEWQVEVVGQKPVAVTWKGDRRFHVLGTPGMVTAGLPVSFDPNETKQAGAYARAGTPAVQDVTGLSLRGATTIRLSRKVGTDWVVVDSVNFASAFAPVGDPNGPTFVHVAQRDITDGRRIQRLWGDSNGVSHLGNGTGNFVSTSTNLLQARPTSKPFINIGELGMLFRTNAYSIPNDSKPEDVLVNLADSRFADLFNYLTVIDPNQHGQPVGVTPISGRINVNTAPWRVLAALPWIQYPANTPARAQAIVDYRNANGPFKSVGDLMRVRSLWLTGDANDKSLPDGPDATPDQVKNDEEERDVIFTRISDLVTVRSDVFTAYILVRIGEKGPQRRMIAILDRSQATRDDPRVRLVALHAVADPW